MPKRTRMCLLTCHPLCTGYPDLRLAQLSPHKGAKPGVISWESDWEKGDVLGNEQLLGMVVVPSPQAQALGQATGGCVCVRACVRACARACVRALLPAHRARRASPPHRNDYCST
jgi:hypothetical protein